MNSYAHSGDPEEHASKVDQAVLAYKYMRAGGYGESGDVFLTIADAIIQMETSEARKFEEAVCTVIRSQVGAAPDTPLHEMLMRMESTSPKMLESMIVLSNMWRRWAGIPVSIKHRLPSKEWKEVSPHCMPPPKVEVEVAMTKDPKLTATAYYHAGEWHYTGKWERRAVNFPPNLWRYLEGEGQRKVDVA